MQNVVTDLRQFTSKLPFKVGVQTIIWGEPIADLATCLVSIRDSGYKGVEFCQVPSGMDLSTSYSERSLAEKIDKLLDRYQLQLLGFSGGSLEKRIAFSNLLYHKPLYYYIESWKESYRSFLDVYALAIHPHLYKEIRRPNLALNILDFDERLKFLPDTAHLYLAGVNVVDILESQKQRLAAVHLKDWTCRYGWSRTMYSRGFTELGRGDLSQVLHQCYDWMMKNYDGWVVAEQDHTELTPEESIYRSRQWIDNPKNSSGVRFAPRLAQSIFTKRDSSLTLLKCIDMMHQSQLRTLDVLYKTILKCLSDLTGAAAASLWEINSETRMMSHEEFYFTLPSVKSPTVLYLPLDHALSGEAVSERTVTIKQLDDTFRDLEFAEQNRFSHMVSVPVGNLFNINSPEILVNLFFRHQPNKSIDKRRLTSFAKHISIAVDSSWTELRNDTIDELAMIGDGTETDLSIYLQKPLRFVLQKLSSDHAFIFFVDEAELNLKLICHTTRIEESNRLFSSVDVGGTAKLTLGKNHWLSKSCWIDREEINYVAEDNLLDNPKVAGLGLSRIGSLLALPLHKQNPLGAVQGVLVLVREGTGKTMPFSVHEEIIVDAVGCFLSPNIERLMIAERRKRYFCMIKHELEDPATTILNEAQELDDDRVKFNQVLKAKINLINRQLRSEMSPITLRLDDFKWSPEHNSLEDVINYSKVMKNVITGLGILNLRGEVHPKVNRVLMHRDVIRAAVHHIHYTEGDQVDGEKIDITFTRTEDLPPMYLDKLLFIQVILNLLRNAIKYRKPGLAPKIRLVAKPGKTTNSTLQILDWGIGIKDGWEERIFEEGVRGPDAKDFSSDGDGYGLFLVRSILQAHGATIRVTRNAEPTTFTIEFPFNLTNPLKTKFGK